MQPIRSSIRSVLLATVVMGALLLLRPADAAAQLGLCNPCQKTVTSCSASGGCTTSCAPDPSKAGVQCRGGSGDACNPAEYCTDSGVCPADVKAPAGTMCRESAGACDVAEVCDGTGAPCSVIDRKVASGTVCRAATDACDAAETCNGRSSQCPADALKAAGATCRASAGACDVAETCDGTSSACPADAIKPAGAVCRAVAGACDVAEACDGASTACPTNTFAAAGTECRAAAGACDAAEACTGSSGSCPTDTKVAAGTVCRDASGVCDAAEACTGTANDCPADAVKSAGTECRGAAGACDVAESCDGAVKDCPADVLVAAGTTCRDGNGECDPGEACTGANAECPADTVVAEGTPCTEDSDLCTIDACDGAGACGHTPAADTDDDGTCDGQDPCTNVGGARTLLDASKPTLALTRINLDTTTGDDGLKLKASFDLPADKRFSDLALDLNGAHLIVDAAGGDRVIDALLPAGMSSGNGTRGWTRAKNGKSWTYADKTGAPVAGIVKVQVLDKSKADAPGRVQVSILGKDGDYPVLADDVPLAAIVTLGSQTDAAAGLCTESAYAADDCALDRKGTSLTCKR